MWLSAASRTNEFILTIKQIHENMDPAFPVMFFHLCLLFDSHVVTFEMYVPPRYHALRHLPQILFRILNTGFVFYLISVMYI